MRKAFVLTCLLAAAAVPATAQETPGPGAALTGNGRHLEPAGRLTQVGSFPTGGALTPDGRFYWTVDAGRGATAVHVVDVASGAVTQTLPIPGGYVGIAFAPDGRRAYVSGEPRDGDFGKGLKGEDGDVIHAFDVDPASGAATEADPIPLPDARDGAAASDELPPASAVNAWPEGLAVTPDGKQLVVALGQADQVAIIPLADPAKATLANVGRYPYAVAIDPKRPRAYVTNERDGTVSVVDVPSGKQLATIEVGGERGAAYAHPEGIAADPIRDRMYVAVTDRDLVAVLDTNALKLDRYVDVGRKDAAIGTAPVEPAVSPSGDTLYVAGAGEDAVAAIALERRPAARAKPHPVVRARSVAKIRRYRTALARARKQRARHRLGGEQFKARVRTLRKRYLRGTLTKRCSGPTRKQDAAYGKAVLRALELRARALERKQARGRVERAFERRLASARRKLPPLARCARPGYVPNAAPFSVLGRIPTAAYPTDVEVSGDGKTLVWLAAKGLGTGPNNGADPDISRLTVGHAGVLTTRRTDGEVKALTATANRQIVPTNFKAPPQGTPLIADDGSGPSDKIKHVFYVVRENRTYDQIFGSEPRGRGDPRLQLFDDNGVPGPTGGVTPNAHALARAFPLLD